MAKVSKAYNNPEYYEIALSGLRNIRKDVDFLDKAAKKYSKVKVKSMLEIGCGNSPYVEEISNRGYNFVGLDLNQKMLDFSKNKAKKQGIIIKTVRADMLNFKLKDKVDFCFVLFNSIYRKNHEDFLRHLKCVANSMKKGGLYVMHMVVEGAADELEGRFIDYAKKGGIKVKAVYDKKIIDMSKQLSQENITIYVNDNGRKIKLFEANIQNLILPQEFKLLIEKSDFEFVEWFDGFNINKKFDGLKRCEFVVSVIRKK